MAEQRAVLVTGGSGGIGRVTAERLARDGMAIAVHYAGNRERAEEVVASITDQGGRAVAVGGDVADLAAMTDAFDAVDEHFGGIDVVVHTAGRMVLAPLAELDLDEVDAMHSTNIRGTFVVSRLAAQRVRAGGAIINFSSTVVKLALPTYSAYAASKAAVEAVSLILAKELSGRDITVNAVAPGPTATPLFLDGKSPEEVDRMSTMNPMGRLGEPSDIAEVVAFLAGPGRWINGQVVYVNGGAI